MSIKSIANPLDGERVVALSPETANEAATDWLRRPNLFPGRALTAPTLEQRQRWQASRIVVRSPLSRRTPANPRILMARSTAPELTVGIVVRRSCAVILRRPYRPSGVSSRRPSGLIVQATSRTASTTWASLIVLAAGRRIRQAR